MKLKKKLRNFFTLTRKANGGFTLVELIVVIAIMGVLAGVGTVGYSGYVKSANKKADMVLVGNVVRAIEVGSNSTMFTPPEPLAVGATTYPVGFIVLNTTGGKTLTSGSTVIDVNGACEFSGGATFYYMKPVTTTPEGCTQGTSVTVYEKIEMNTNYCLTHSSNKPAAGGTYAQKYTFSETEEDGDCGGTETVCNPQLVPHSFGNGELATANIDKLYSVSTGGKCQFAASAGIDNKDVINSVINTDTGVLSEAIKAAFGDTSNLALKYDKWGEDAEDEVSYTTLYGSAAEMFEKVDGVASLLVDLQGLKSISSSFASFFSDEYENSGDLMISFAEFATKNQITAAKWDEYWKEAGKDSAHDEYDFHIGSNGGKNDYIWATRMAYNASFASYCEAHGIPSTYTNVITNYGQNAYAQISDKAGALSSAANAFLNATVPEHKNTNIPSVANAYAFDKTKTTQLYDQFIATAGNNDAKKQEAADMFDECGKLYEQYRASDICSRNGREFYNTLITIADTGDVATDPSNNFGGNYLAYYQSYLDEMATLYDEAVKESKGGIMIIVTMENGVTKCEVSPASADPRRVS